jgi:hypothetical protein
MGQAPGPYYANDIALIEVAAPFPREAIEQATLAPPGSFAAESTLAGFGASNFKGGTSGRFNITWPRLLTATDGRFTFAPDDGSAFCQGDSGGPVYAGRQRGCRPDDLAPEPRPRRIQAVISFDQPGTLVDPSTATDIELAQSCIFSPLMSMQSVTVPELRQWICTTTNDEAGGCP